MEISPILREFDIFSFFKYSDAVEYLGIQNSITPPTVNIYIS